MFDSVSAKIRMLSRKYRRLSQLFLFSATLLLTGRLEAVRGLTAATLAQDTDLDAFMRQVMERRDDNWKKLQQYILDEREEVDVRGPGGFPLWGERSEYTWFIRDGFFVRSPLRVNGATVGEGDRRKYEADYLRRAQARDRRERERQARSGQSAETPNVEQPSATNIGGFIQQTRQPEFISSAYFLRFKFDAGRYALVGREQLDGLDVLRVEYYPTRLFSPDDNAERRERRRERQDRPENTAVQATVNRLLNKGSRVTLWIEPRAHQILKYTFDNVDVDFFPAQWLASVTGLHASMAMSQPFPEVWLPRETDVQIGLMFALGEVDLKYRVSYNEYRQADVTTAIRVPGAR
jgi:hypothetical protein